MTPAVEIDKLRITDQLVRVPSGDGKPRAIQEVIKKTPNAAFGNSRWDTEMLAMYQHAFAINPNPDLGKGTGFRRALDAAGISFAEAIETLIMSAYSRRSP